MSKTKFGFLQISLIYFTLYLGIRSVIEILLGIIVAPFLPQIYNALSSPNFTFSLSNFAVVFIQLTGLLATVILAAKYASLLLPIKAPKKIAALATIWLLIYSFLPTIRFLFMNQTAHEYLLNNTSYISFATIIHGVTFILFFLLSSYFLRVQK